MEFHDAKDETIPFATILILGDSGGGKTKLASEMPGAFFFDIEGGAHHTGCDRVTFPKEGKSYNLILNALKEIARLEQQADGLLHWQPRGAPKPFLIGTLVIDTLDCLQEIVDKTITKTGMQYWGEMLKKMGEVIDTAKCCNCHVVLIAHTGERNTQSETEKQQRKPSVPKMSLDLGGKIRNKIPGWVDASLNVVVEPDGTRKIITQQCVIDGRSYYAKDRYNFFNGRTLTITFDKDGRIRNDLLQPVLDRCTGGSRVGHEAMALSEAKEALVQAAIDNCITLGRSDRVGMQRLVDLLKEHDLTPDDALAKKEECLKVVEGYEPPTPTGALDFEDPPPAEEEEAA
jgi:hypothetical protein